MTQADIFGFLFPLYKITKPIRLIELFAGVGSQAMALRDIGANFEHHRVIEIDPFAIKSYNAIHGTSFEPLDIAHIHGVDLAIFDKKQYEYIMTYSFPCQDLSKAGKQKGMAKDSGTRSGLLWEVERILLELQERNELPQVLVMENVPDVINEKNRKDFDQWYTSLERMGYQSYYKLLNAKDYGVPQSRNRCFMVSILGNYSYTFPESIPLEKKLRDVLESEVDEKYYINDKVARKFANKDDISKAIRTSGRSSLDRHSWDVIQIGNCMSTANRDNPNQGRVYSIEGLSPTLCAMQGGNRQPMVLQNGHGFNKGGIKEICPTITTGAFRENNFVAEPLCLNSKVDGKQPSLQDRIYDTDAISTAITTSFMPNIYDQRIRKLTPLECWRLMNYTDEDFYKAKAVNSNTQLYKQAGNGIVKAVLMAIFKELIEQEDQMLGKSLIMDNELNLFDRLNVIRDVVKKYSEDKFYISFSGGKDSTVLHHLIDEALPGNRIPRVYADTGIEYNAIKEFVKELQAHDDRIEVIRPSQNIKQMLERDGYPFKSKEHSNIVRVFQNSGMGLTVNRYLSGNYRNPCPQVLRYQFSDKNTLKISDKCCRRMKKEPFNIWMKENSKTISITGMMSSEGGQRKRIESCIITDRDGHLKKFHPLLKVSKEWEEWYIQERGIKLCKLYYPPYNFARTGCKGCPYALGLQEQLEVMFTLMPEEYRQCEIIWKPVYDEYRRIGYRLKKVIEPVLPLDTLSRLAIAK